MQPLRALRLCGECLSDFLHHGDTECTEICTEVELKKLSRNTRSVILHASLKAMRRIVSHTRVFALLILVLAPSTLFAQSIAYPKEIRGYKLERAAVELKETKQKNDQQNTSPQLIQFGSPRVASVTPLGIGLEIPVVVSAVKQKGRVDFLVFEKMKVNGTSVEIDEYHRGFDLPNKKSLTLKEPLRFYVYLPNAILAAIDELSSSGR